MRIVFVSPLLNLGGGQRYISTLANSWAEQGHEVSIIVLRAGERFYRISPEINIYELDYSYTNKLSKIYSGVITFFRLRKKIKEINPTFVLSILGTTNILTLLATSFLPTKVFIRDAFNQKRKRKKIELFFRKLLYRKASGIIAQTKEIKIYNEKETGNRNVKVIPNPVRKIPINKNIKKEKIVLNTGRLVHAKGQKYFLEACAKINNPEWKFVILGEGPFRKSLEEQAIKMNITERLLMPGAVKNVDEWLLKSSIYAFPSLYEGLPNALIEAMVAGLPCISFDCENGPSDLIRDGKNGFLVPVGDIDLFVGRLKQLMADQELRDSMSKEAVKTEEIYSLDKISKEVLDFCSQ